MSTSKQISNEFALIEIIGKLKDAKGRILIPGFYTKVKAPGADELRAWKKLPFDEEHYRKTEVGATVLTGEPGFSVQERTWSRPTLEVHGMPGGFISLSQSAQNFAGVGCENCHGPSAAHVANPKTRTPFAAADQCVRCHDHENSPKFDYAQYWPRVKHGLDPKPATQPVAAIRGSE